MCFFAEINNVIYVLKYEKFQTYLHIIYTPQATTTNAILAILYLITSLNGAEPELFRVACLHGNASMEEGSLESVQALMLMVSSLVLSIVLY